MATCARPNINDTPFTTPSICPIKNRMTNAYTLRVLTLTLAKWGQANNRSPIAVKTIKRAPVAAKACTHWPRVCKSRSLPSAAAMPSSKKASWMRPVQLQFFHAIDQVAHLPLQSVLFLRAG